MKKHYTASNKNLQNCPLKEDTAGFLQIFSLTKKNKGYFQESLSQVEKIQNGKQ